MKYNVDDRVVIVGSEDDTLIGKSGRIIDVDEDWMYPYEIQFDNEELNGSDKEVLFAGVDIMLYDEYMKRYDEPVEAEVVSPDNSEPVITYSITPSSDIITDIKNLVNRIKAEYPQCRESSLAITKLDEARLWLNEIGIK